MSCVWTSIGTLGLRNISCLARSFSSTYEDTVYYYGVSKYPNVRGYVALTIDDGLARHGRERSLVPEVQALLRKHGASATFFICSDYLAGVEDQARSLLEDGHELENHCPRDREYASFEPAEFEAALVKTNTALAALSADGKGPRWFRAPQAKFTWSMKECVEKHHLRHALADCCAGDWEVKDPVYIAENLLWQCDHGSIIVLHMPEQGFREQAFEALRLLLEGLSSRGMKILTLSQLDELANATEGEKPLTERESRPSDKDQG
eukprot:TRINITY_DN73684_c0_g1_i1.p1 TRINITY_DN73684_c0_g1~~TRINITY_DN73684_c0_g1_i1.p1  ORF type:complete len:264 (+),score=43.33 TRINITY_DN73684_c0_g1_i1:23-814(+)